VVCLVTPAAFAGDDRGPISLDRGNPVDPELRRIATPRQGADVAATDSSAHLELTKAQALFALSELQERSEAITTLQRIVSLGLRSTPEADKLLSAVYQRFAGLYQETPLKQAHLLGGALVHASDPGVRTELESSIAALGGDALEIRTRYAPSSTDAIGVQDVCTDALAATLPFSTVMSIFPSGDHDWFSFTLNTASGGARVRIETISDTPGSFADDTDLTLYGGCDTATSVPLDLIAFNDDGVGVNAPFMSRIDTDCLPNETYYVEVGGFADISTPDNFELEIEIIEDCTIPTPDQYEPDDTADLATPIGYPNAPSAQAARRRPRTDSQVHSIFPSADVDNMSLDLNQNLLVRLKTTNALGLGGIIPQGGSLDPVPNPDTVLNLLYAEPKDYGGRCNDADIGFVNSCRTDEDCPPSTNPVPGFPDCIPLAEFGGLSHFAGNPPLAVNDDVSLPSNLGSELLLCLPSTGNNSDAASVNGDWIAEVSAFSTTDFFEYQVQATNEVRCNYESEPNNSLTTPNPLTLGDTVHGIFEFSETWPFQDADLFSFDVTEDSLVRLETSGYDSFRVDTALDLIVGPDDNGDFFLLAEDDNGGVGNLSKLEVILPPASDLLGNATADADYLLNVTSDQLNPNFPYTLHTEAVPPPKVETEPNDTCGVDSESTEPGDEWLSSINPTCDFDTYKLTVTEDTFVTIETSGAGDTTVQLRDCSDDSELACDDDGGPGLLSLIDGCLPPGEYCVKVRAFSGFATFGYGLDIGGVPGCAPTDPPTMSGDGLFTCASGFDICP
jgi:hypothetical protein